MSTIVDVARKANVSRATVTRVLNEPEKVKPETRRRVENAIETLNYSPNLSARSLVSKNSGIIGMLLPDNESGFFGSVMSVVNKKVSENSRMLMVLEGEGIEAEEKSIRKLVEINCDGFILYNRYLSSKKVLSYIKNKPVVFIDRMDPTLISVGFDHYLAGAALMNKLLDAGHVNLAIVAGPSDRENSVARLRGCLSALAEKNISIDKSKIYQGDYNHSFGQQATTQLLDAHPDLTAILYCGERMCAGGLKAIRAKGISVPQSLSIATFDSYMLTEYLTPTIDSVVYPVTDMAMAAADMIINLLSKSPQPIQSVTLPHYFNSGNSIG